MFSAAGRRAVRPRPVRYAAFRDNVVLAVRMRDCAGCRWRLAASSPRSTDPTCANSAFAVTLQSCRRSRLRAAENSRRFAALPGLCCARREQVPRCHFVTGILGVFWTSTSALRPGLLQCFQQPLYHCHFQMQLGSASRFQALVRVSQCVYRLLEQRPKQRKRSRRTSVAKESRSAPEGPAMNGPAPAPNRPDIAGWQPSLRRFAHSNLLQSKSSVR